MGLLCAFPNRSASSAAFARGFSVLLLLLLCAAMGTRLPHRLPRALPGGFAPQHGELGNAVPRPPPLQEDNHSYYVSRTYGPGDARLRGLWVDMAAANRSQVKIHGILSNTHRQASVSPRGCSAAGGVPWVSPPHLPSRDFPAVAPRPGQQRPLHVPRTAWWRPRLGKCLVSPSPGLKGMSRGDWAPAGPSLPSLSHPSVHRPRELAPSQGRAGAGGHGPVPPLHPQQAFSQAHFSPHLPPTENRPLL